MRITMLVKSFLAQRWLVRLIPAAFLGLFVFSFVFTYMNVIPRRGSFSFDALPICDAEVEPAVVQQANYSIVLWTSYFNLQNHPAFDDSPVDPKLCAYTNCAFSVDRDEVDAADAVVFHQADMSLSDLPPTRRFRQRWIMYNQESPPNSFTLSPAYNGIFNWSMTYSRTDDIVVPYFETCRPANLSDSAINEIGAGTEEKAWAAVWFVSNCRGPSNRMAYVEELQNYITIDIIGACSPRNIQCAKDNHKACLDTFLPRYRFVLAFENSICNDYVTEKLRNVLPYDVIPIFWGGVDYGEFLPRESFVVATDYPNPRDLARALYRFRNNDLFRRTLSYRRGVQARGVSWKCRLCEKLNKSGNQTSVKRRLYQTSHRNGRCKVWRRGHFQEHFPH
ncbi:alpha-(1,3)-fucosyltransferase 5-like [Varroa jacobsoni]|uniref:alpha-(1,3)-fucosyltransferase 5-like n=1 Tax=Varroa jacobsoni TaxID=62625 RepID=UPI000BF841F1|nr:alpha-(1,3)-fucosyltransferase 5-like [Varroa jacobsoni]XP_022701445.1 alpha-(1,3)-fucosyltransferase 5-like [Varroa jacobsoni]